MEERKWENLNSDCLVNVFGRLDLETMLLDVPLICKQWYQALVNPLCWPTLVFPVDINRSRLANHSLQSGGSFYISRLIKFVVDRSKGSATTLVLPVDATVEDLIYVSDVCPSLKTLALSNSYGDSYGFSYEYGDSYKDSYGDTISKIIVKWKSLEVLKLEHCSLTADIIYKIGLHCKNFVELSVTNDYIDQEVASAIVSKLVTIKRLVLDNSKLEKDDLVLILRGCQGLELLSVRNCVGFDEDDEEILKIASRIKDFRCESPTDTDCADDDINCSDSVGYDADYWGD